MRKTYKIISGLIAPVLAVSTLLPPVSASFLSNVYYSESRTLLPGLDYSELYCYSEENAVDSDGKETGKTETANQRAFLLTYDPSSSAALPVISWGEYIYGRETLDEIIENDAAIDPEKTAAAINADFFSFKTGVPLGVMIRDGSLCSNGENPNALVITGNSAYITQPRISASLSMGELTAEIAYVNKYPSKYGAYLLTGEFGETTRSSGTSREIVLKPESETLTLNSTIKAIVTEVREGVTDTKIPDGCFVLTMEADGDIYSDALYSSLKKGDAVELSISASEDVSGGVSLCVGGGDLILDGGVWDESLADETHEKEKNPRTAVGITAEGKVIFFACDGRKSGYSDGLTLAELAGVMAELGCVDAMNLDGGGSTTVIIEGETVNSPTDGKQRAISDAVVFLNALDEEDGLESSISLTSDCGAVLKNGGSCALEAYLRLADYTTGELLPNDGIAYEVTPKDIGYVENGRFVAYGKAGVATITASAKIGGKTITGSAAVTVMDGLTSLRLKTDYASVAAGGTLKIWAEGYYRNAKVGVSLSQLTFEDTRHEWEQTGLADGEIAYSGAGLITVDPDDAAAGILHAPEDNYNTGLECRVNASLGELSATVKVLFGVADTLLEDFESASKLGESYEKGCYESVDGGRNSNNAVSIDKALTYKTPLEALPGVRGFTIWIKGTADIALRLTDSDGVEYELAYEPVMQLHRLGWSEYRATVPEEAAQPVKIVSPVAVKSGEAVVADNFTSEYGALWTHFTDMNGQNPHWSLEYVRAAYEMGIIDGYSSQYNPAINFMPDGNLTRAEFAKLLSVYLGIDVEKENETAFADEYFPDWARSYVSAVVSAGLMKGKASDGEGLLFDPEGYITRAEVMQVFGGLLNSDKEKADLSGFSDSADIPDWSAENVSKTVAEGIVTGYADGTLKPGGDVTRAEICAMFVRLDSCEAFLYE